MIDLPSNVGLIGLQTFYFSEIRRPVEVELHMEHDSDQTVSILSMSHDQNAFLAMLGKITIQKSLSLKLHVKRQSLLVLVCSIRDIARSKVFRMNPEFRILRLTFHRKSASKC